MSRLDQLRADKERFMRPFVDYDIDIEEPEVSITWNKSLLSYKMTKPVTTETPSFIRYLKDNNVNVFEYDDDSLTVLFNIYVTYLHYLSETAKTKLTKYDIDKYVDSQLAEFSESKRLRKRKISDVILFNLDDLQLQLLAEYTYSDTQRVLHEFWERQMEQMKQMKDLK